MKWNKTDTMILVGGIVSSFVIGPVGLVVAIVIIVARMKRKKKVEGLTQRPVYKMVHPSIHVKSVGNVLEPKTNNLQFHHGLKQWNKKYLKGGYAGRHMM